MNGRLPHFDGNLEGGRGKGERGETAKGVASTIGAIRIDGWMKNVD